MKILKNSFFIIKDKKKQRNFIQILLLLMLITPSAAQENTSLKQAETIFDKKSQTPIFLLGSYQFNMLHNQGFIFDSSFSLSIELHVNTSFNINKYSAFIYVKTGGLFFSSTTPKLQAGTGVSGYVYNNRNVQTKLGWSVMLGSGLLMNIDFENRYNDMGYELFLRGQYNFHKYVGVVFGLSFEHFFIVEDLWDKDFAYLDNNINLFNISTTVGLAF